MLVETTEELVINEPIPNEPAIVNLPTETKEISNKPVVDEVIISNSEPMIATRPMVSQENVNDLARSKKALELPDANVSRIESGKQHEEMAFARYSVNAAPGVSPAAITLNQKGNHSGIWTNRSWDPGKDIGKGHQLRMFLFPAVSKSTYLKLILLPSI